VHPFRNAIEAQDLDAAIALTRQDVVFRSPVVFRPYHGREALRTILEAVTSVFEDFRYVREIGDAGARDQVLMFEARIDDKQVEGADFIRLDDDGAIGELTVMVRPMAGMHALAQAMKDRLAAMDAVGTNGPELV
jgi:limonene-1,2-epoxide hydrolase